MKYFTLRQIGEEMYAVGKAFTLEGCTCNFHKQIEILPGRYVTETVATQIMEQYNSDLQTVKNIFIQTTVEFA